MKEKQITAGKYGHTLNAAQVFSPDGKWIVYDTRNEDTHISRTGKIEKVNLESGEIVTLYTTKNQTLSGPGVGAVAHHPIDDKIIYIHGLLNCSEELPYGFARRFGAITNTTRPEGFKHAEARMINSPFVTGALRGGTHAHTWSGDGTWISFTYNDYLMESQEKSTNGQVKDLRTIGVMTPAKSVDVGHQTAEEFSGLYFTVVAATVMENPRPGTDDIDRAFDECWIGRDGYVKKDGTIQRRAVAFQGNTRDSANAVLTEVFVSDIPDDVTQSSDAYPLTGTLNTRPNVPLGLIQRRLTVTTGNKHPGVQGPRCRLRSSPDGSVIYFPMMDDHERIQVYAIPTVGGQPNQVTHFDQSIQAQFNVSPGGEKMSCISNDCIWVVDLKDYSEPKQLTRKESENIVGGALWSPDGSRLVFNRYTGTGDDRYLQIYAIDVD